MRALYLSDGVDGAAGGFANGEDSTTEHAEEGVLGGFCVGSEIGCGSARLAGVWLSGCAWMLFRLT